MKTSTKIVPCLWLDDGAERAAAFYTGLFPNSRVVTTTRYPESIGNPGNKPKNSVLTVEFELADQRFTALNGGPQFKPNQTLSFFVQVGTADEATKFATTLLEGGTAMMPLGSYPWSPCYAWVQDRFGVSWQVMTTTLGADDPMIVPCFMFSGAVHKRAEEAIRTWVHHFPDSKVERIERYAEGEGPVDSVKHGRFRLAGQSFVAMDSHLEHGAAFSEGLSLQVMCDDQAEVNRTWLGLSQEGTPGPCGWLKDRFGFSWQVVPSRMPAWFSGDGPARDRVFAAMMPMMRLDIALLEKAFVGEAKVISAAKKS